MIENTNTDYIHEKLSSAIGAAGVVFGESILKSIIVGVSVYFITRGITLVMKLIVKKYYKTNKDQEEE